MKVIQISSASSSFAVKNYEEDVFLNWNARVGFELEKAYPELEVEIWSIEKKQKREKIMGKNNIKFRVFPTNLSIRHGVEISFDLIKALKSEINKAEIEKYKLIIHIHEYHSLLSYLLLKNIKKAGNIKIICQHHGGRAPFANLKKHKKLWLVFPAIACLQALENYALKKVDLFYCLSDEELQYARKFGKAKFQTMGIGEEYFSKLSNKAKLRKKLGLNKKKYVLYIGRIKKTKGISELLEAARNLREVEFLLIGGGDEAEVNEYKKLTMEMKLKNVKFLGSIYGDKKIEYLDAVDCLVLPSYTEGAPVVVMEAIARNLPVAVSDVGGVRRMIQEEGIIIKPKSSEEVIRGIKEILTWKKNIRKYAEKYKWNKIIKQTYEDYVN